jgi:glutamate synthase domain-containing protein 2/glutamate synthase domain-containing protein 1
MPASSVTRNREDARCRDACGILGGLTRERAPLGRFVRMLDAMGHRGGDGLGVHFRIPREVLERELSAAAHRAPGVMGLDAGVEPLVLTLQVPGSVAGARAVACSRDVLERHGFRLLYALPVSRPTRDAECMRTWRCVARDAAPARLAERMLAARRELEARAGSDGLPPSFFPASFSAEGMVLYKLVGSLDDWLESFGRETLEAIRTDCFLAHVRYSTNTLPRHRSAQPFGLLAHNGEINNIAALRRAMWDRGRLPSRALSDSADLNELVEELCVLHRLALPEALQLLFPRRWISPAATDGAAAWHDHVSRTARAVRAEGPAALVASDGHCLVGRLDSLGLRPLALVETRTGVFFASEPGAVGPLAELERIQQLRPGEMIAVCREAGDLRIVGHAALDTLMRARRAAGPARRDVAPIPPVRSPRSEPGARPALELRYAAAGFSPRVRRQLEALFLEGREIGSGTGWRGGLAVTRGPGARLADAFQAMTAQVTAPTLSAEHEMAAMNGRVVLGADPALGLAPGAEDDLALALALPIVLAGEDLSAAGTDALEEAAGRLQILTLPGLRARAGPAFAEIDARVETGAGLDGASGAERIRAALERIRAEAVAHAGSGAHPLLALRCTWGAEPQLAPLPPELVVGAVDHELSRCGLRRRVSLLVVSEAISDPHSMFVLLQLGADALVPTLLCEEVLALAERSGSPPVDTLERGLSAIARALFIMYGRIATTEISAGRGGRRVCALGLDAELGEAMGLPSRLGAGHGFSELWRGLELRSRILSEEAGAPRALAETSVDTMPLDVALGSYALLGGFKPAPGRRRRSRGQLRVAARVLAESLERRRSGGREQCGGLPPVVRDDRDVTGLLHWLDGLPIERLAELHSELYALLRDRAHGFLDSLRLALPAGGRASDWKAVGSGLDGRRNNQILGAISYGANNRLVHELYARVMARCGAMSNGGEGGVPDHVRALYVTARLAARGAGARALERQLAEEAPAYLKGLGAEQRAALCRRLLQTVPEDFPASRFEQISTARFGVDAYAFHDARFLEIKIGQGAKPGVGGSLPGEKVLPAIAATRGVNVGQTLNSPTVHHDIYSIEDLRQLITALKTFNPAVRVCVKLAAMDDLDVTALGVVKAGADFIWIDGYEGGTGSAKDAHKEHCGLPAAPVLRQVHEMLLAEGMRGGYRRNDEALWITRRDFHRLSRLEQGRYRWHGPRLIGSGGVRSAEDALKLVLVGADYVGYGDAAQNAVGCIRCEKCHTGRCPSYVATNDVRRSKAFDAAGAESTLTRFVELIDVGMRKLAADLAPGALHLEELVGRTDLLRPAAQACLRIESGFFAPVEEGDPAAAFRLDPGRDSAAVRRPAAVRLERALAGWQHDVHRALLDQGLDPGDPDALAEVEPGALRLPETLRRLEVEVQVDNRDRLLGTGVVRAFVELRRLVKLATGVPLELALQARGAAGSGFGMFAVHGMDLTLVGTGGDYLGEAVNGARCFVLPAPSAHGRLLAGSGMAGSASVYGMRDGEVHLFDQPGTRFGIRLSGGSVFVWGDPESVEASFGADVVKPQFTGEYMTRGTLVLCRDPGHNLLCAATGRDTEILCRKPEGLEREAWARELARRIPAGFEVTGLEPRHAALIERGARSYRERARSVGIEARVTPLRPDEDPRSSFLLLRERSDAR